MREMCFSARVRQNLKKLSRRYHAEVDWAAFEELYKRRAEGEDIKASRDLQRNFQSPETEVEKRTAVYIAQYLKGKQSEWENEIFVQRRRLAGAEELLTKRETKRAREDIRIAAKKVCNSGLSEIEAVGDSVNCGAGRLERYQ